MNQPAQRGLTPLLQVLQMKNLDMLNVLLEAGVNANVIIKKEEETFADKMLMQREAAQQTPLMIAACMKAKDLYEALLTHGADATITDGAPKPWSAEQYYNHYLHSGWNT